MLKKMITCSASHRLMIKFLRRKYGQKSKFTLQLQTRFRGNKKWKSAAVIVRMVKLNQ